MSRDPCMPAAGNKKRRMARRFEAGPGVRSTVRITSSAWCCRRRFPASGRRPGCPCRCPTWCCSRPGRHSPGPAKRSVSSSLSPNGWRRGTYGRRQDHVLPPVVAYRSF
ncbi:PadR family transcriptional regulator (plasmid) [Ralstonia solanacearum]|nr:PadR family transcriptional regulator [Ralstonia solanacearum]